MQVTSMRVFANLFFCSFFFVTTFFSCNQDAICIEPKTVTFLAGFYAKDTATTWKDSALTNANLRYGINYNTFVNIKKSKQIRMPLSPLQDEMEIVFQSDSTLTDPATIDTIHLQYTRELHFISSACGYQTFYALQQINSTKNVIDSIRILHTDVTNEMNKEHFQISLRK